MNRNMGWIVVLAVACVVGGFASRAASGETPAGGETNAPVNQWVLRDTVPGKAKVFCATVYMPATDEFLLWGQPPWVSRKAAYNPAGGRFEVETFSVKTGKWADAKPDYALPEFPNNFRDTSISTGGGGAHNHVSFIATNGIERPSRAATFHQLTYDTKRDRVLFYVGGQTFSYDPRTRKWTSLKPAKRPLACQMLVWASLCYDPVNDEAVLFGGGIAANQWGGAYTWLYDCEKNVWRALEQPREKQPPLRGCVQTAYDAKNQCIVLFGGNAQDRYLADTWVYDVKTREWSERKPELSPPPVNSCGMAYLAKDGLILMVGAGHDITWTYDTAGNRWTRCRGNLGLDSKDASSSSFMSCAWSSKDNRALLVGMGFLDRFNLRKTWLYDLDPATAAHPKQQGSAPGGFQYAFSDFPALEKAPPPDRKANLERLSNLPANTFVDANPPVTVTMKNWSTATIDTDKGEVIYTGGGHNCRGGNDWCHYSVADNRWSASWPAKIPPYLGGCGVKAAGWAYGAQPWPLHTRHNYQYDPQSRKVVLIGGNYSEFQGREVCMSDKPEDAFVYSPKKHGYVQYVYDPATKKLSLPLFDCPYGFSMVVIGMVGTPHGLYAINSKDDMRLLHGTVTNNTCRWEPVGKDKAPSVGGTFELHPMIYDSKRDRLLQLYGHPGDKGDLTIFAYPFATGKWEKVETSGHAEVSRDAVYVSKQDTLMVMGADKVLVMNCEERVWRILDCAIPAGAGGMSQTMVYDPVHDVTVLLRPRRFNGPVGVHMLRYDPKTAKYKDPAASQAKQEDKK